MFLKENFFKKCSFILAGLFISSCVQSQTTMTWCAYYNWAPWIYSSGKSYDGILIEQLRLFEKEHKIKAEAIIIDNWKRCQLEVANGHVDIILGANKTLERQKILRFLQEPSFINKSAFSAYALFGNENVQKVKVLDDLRRYKLSMVRGNSFGKVVNEFINSLDETNIGIVNSQEQVLKLVALKRYDYFFANETSYLSMLAKYRKIAPQLNDVSYRKFFSMEREVPVYIALTKKEGTSLNLESLWLKTIRSYHASVDVNERINFHNKNANSAKN